MLDGEEWGRRRVAVWIDLKSALGGKDFIARGMPVSLGRSNFSVSAVSLV